MICQVFAYSHTNREKRQNKTVRLVSEQICFDNVDEVEG